MRTYSRKRPDYQLIEGVEELCRLCLEKSNEVVPIYTDDSDNLCASLALRIMICVGLEVTREDCLPNMICIECHRELERYYSFRKKCEVSYQKLKSHLHAVKEVNRAVMALEKEKKNDIQVKQNKMDNDIDNINIQSEETDQSNDVEMSNILVNPRLSTFLTEILADLEVVMQQDNKIVLLNEEVNAIQLEMGDGNQVSLQLVEECDEQNDVPDISSNEEKKDIIKYVTSNFFMIDKDKEEKEANVCRTCGKHFSYRCALVRHARTHSGERPYQCRKCGRRFTQKEVMTRHELVHDEERPFKCSSCPKSFTQRGALAAHARSHAPPHARPLALHACRVCPKIFLHPSGLSRHMMMHNGRVYVCGHCNRSFNDKSSLLRHRKTCTVELGSATREPVAVASVPVPTAE